MTESITKEEMEHFFERYRDFTEKFSELRFNEFQTAFNHVRAGLESIQSVACELERHVAKSFNIFNVLGVGTREVKTHSAFIAYLLNPAGKHGQSSLFLKEFIDLLDPPDRLTMEEIETGNWSVEKEKYAGRHGRLDIAVLEQTLGYAIIIENKIYAADQTDQLKRYHDWLKGSSSYKEKGILLYLTLDGHTSKEADRDGVQYQCVSYCNSQQKPEMPSVASWLNRSLSSVAAPRTADMLKQYLHLIETL